MKKSLIALAVLGAFAGSASAQSSVTLYGIFDIGIQYNKQFANTALGQQSVTGVESGYQSGSRWGMRGSEALGGGLNAVFTLEGGYNPDTGTLGQGGRLFGRQAWAGLQSANWGMVVLGRAALLSSGTGSLDMFGAVDPYATGFGINGLQSTFISANATRADNVIAYVTPTFAGFKAGATYSFNISGAEVAPNGNNNRAIGGALSWGQGPFYAVVTYDQVNPADNTFPGRDDQKHLQIGGTWDFGIAKLHAAYAKQDNISPLLGPNQLPSQTTTTWAPGINTFDNTAWGLGVSAPLFGGSIMALWQQANADAKTTTTGRIFEPDYDVWSLGYSYPFSRRTNAYIGYAKRSAKGGDTLWSGGAQSAETLFDRDQFAVGLRHQF